MLSDEAAHNVGEEVGLPGRVDGWVAKAKELTRRSRVAVMRLHDGSASVNTDRPFAAAPRRSCDCEGA